MRVRRSTLLMAALFLNGGSGGGGLTGRGAPQFRCALVHARFEGRLPDGRACGQACVCMRACVRASVRVCVHVCVCVCVCGRAASLRITLLAFVIEMHCGGIMVGRMAAMVPTVVQCVMTRVTDIAACPRYIYGVCSVDVSRGRVLTGLAEMIMHQHC